MRTTVKLDPEVAAAAERLRGDRHIRLGQAVNELARAGLARGEQTTPFRQRTASVGVQLEISDVADALELLDQFLAERTSARCSPTGTSSRHGLDRD